jgi:hypothetical protein
MIEAEKELGPLVHRENSPTAASAHNPLFGPSGVQTYRVRVAGPGGMSYVDVEAATGDEAAAKALESNPGAKVANVSPAPQSAQRHTVEDEAD